MRPVDILFWIRVGLGTGGGLLSGLLGFLGPGIEAYNGILLAIVLYIASYYIGKYVLAIELAKDQSRKYVTAGLGSYIMLYLFTWIIYNTYASLTAPAFP